MFWADTLGSKYICSRLEEWSKSYGGFFKPCAYLADRAAKGASLVRILCDFITKYILVFFSHLFEENNRKSNLVISLLSLSYSFFQLIFYVMI